MCVDESLWSLLISPSLTTVLSLCAYAYIQPAVSHVSPVRDADSDSDDEWNMLGRGVTGKDRHSPHKAEPAKVQRGQRLWGELKMGLYIIYSVSLCNVLMW